MDSISFIGETVLREKDYLGLRNFFREIWQAPHTYKAVMTRRGFNLHYAFLQIEESRTGDANLGEQVISHTALLLYAKDIANYYRENGKFPTILIADDVFLYGRGLAKVIYKLEDLVAWYLNDGKTASQEDLLRIRRHLEDALEIRVYAIGRYPLRVENYYLEKTVSNQQLYEDELLKLSERISIFLQRVGIPNTSFYLSAKVSDSYRNILLNGSTSWEHIAWQYRGTKQSIFLRHGSVESTNFTETVQMYASNCDQKGKGSFWLTGAGIHRDKISDEKLQKQCTILCDTLPDENQFERIKEILRAEAPSLLRQRAQMVFCILSVLCLYDFYKSHDCGFLWSAFDFKDDIDRISRVFERADVQNGLRTGFQILCSNCELLEKVWNQLFCDSLRMGEKHDSVPICMDLPQCYRLINEKAEDYFCGVEMESEYEAYQYGRNIRRFDAHRRSEDTVSLNDYIEKMKLAGGDRFDSTHATEAYCIVCALAMAHSAQISINYEHEENKDEEEKKSSIVCTLKAGELSSFAIPRRYRAFIPAISMVEQNYECIAQDPQSAILGFVNYLDDLGEGSDEDVKLIKGMKKYAQKYLEYVYRCEKKISRWNFNLSSVDDWREYGVGEYLAYLTTEKEKADMYLGKAKEFLACGT